MLILDPWRTGQIVEDGGLRTTPKPILGDEYHSERFDQWFPPISDLVLVVCSQSASLEPVDYRYPASHIKMLGLDNSSSPGPMSREEQVVPILDTRRRIECIDWPPSSHAPRQHNSLCCVSNTDGRRRTEAALEMQSFDRRMSEGKIDRMMQPSHIRQAVKTEAKDPRRGEAMAISRGLMQPVFAFPGYRRKFCGPLNTAFAYPRRRKEPFCRRHLLNFRLECFNPDLSPYFLLPGTAVFLNYSVHWTVPVSVPPLESGLDLGPCQHSARSF